MKQAFKYPLKPFHSSISDLFGIFTSSPSQNTHVVFDVFKDISIKNIDVNGDVANGTLQYKNNTSFCFCKIMAKDSSSSNNKKEIVKFLVAEKTSNSVKNLVLESYFSLMKPLLVYQ